MDVQNSPEGIPVLKRLRLAFKVLFNSVFAGEVKAGLDALVLARAPKPPPERVHAPALFLLSALQREARFIDFLRQDVAEFSDQDVGAAARVVHGGARKVLDQYFTFEPASREPEGSPLTVPAGFDPQRIRLTGNVTGQPPFRGTLKHHGWVATSSRLPDPSGAIDPRVIAPAEVDLT